MLRLKQVKTKKKLMVVKLNSNAFLVRVRVLINVERNKMLPEIIRFLSFASEEGTL